MEGINENQIFNPTVFTVSCSPLKIRIYSELSWVENIVILYTLLDSTNHFLNIS
jgi:hypothetical protein